MALVNLTLSCLGMLMGILLVVAVSHHLLTHMHSKAAFRARNMGQVVITISFIMFIAVFCDDIWHGWYGLPFVPWLIGLVRPALPVMAAIFVLADIAALAVGAYALIKARRNDTMIRTDSKPEEPEEAPSEEVIKTEQ